MTDPRDEILPDGRLPSAPRLCLTRPEAARALGCCVRTLADLIARDGLPVIRYGASTRIPIAPLRRWIRERTARGAESEQ
jgi:excisionase family DNA binding protein